MRFVPFYLSPAFLEYPLSDPSTLPQASPLPAPTFAKAKASLDELREMIAARVHALSNVIDSAGPGDLAPHIAEQIRAAIADLTTAHDQLFLVVGSTLDMVAILGDLPKIVKEASATRPIRRTWPR